MNRAFLTWSEPLLPSAARLLANRHEEDGRVDLSGLVLVVPGARAGRRLLELLASTAEETGRILVPPGSPILTPGTLADHLFDPAGLPRPLASGAAARRAWSRAAEEAGPGTLQQVFPDPALFRGITGRSALAGLLDSLNRTLGAAGKTFSDVTQECGRGLLFSDQDRWTALSGIQETYWRILQDAGLMDREVARKLALRDRLLTAPGEIVLVGVAEMPWILRQMLLALQGQVEAFVHAPEELEDHFDSLGLIRPELWANREIPLEDEGLTMTDRPGDQASAVLRELAELGADVAPEDITVGVPDEGVVPFLEQRLGAYGIPFRYAGGFPLARTSPYRFLAAAADYLAERTFRSFAEFLRHPVFRERTAEVPSPQEMDAFFSRHLPATLHPGKLPMEASGGIVASGLKALHGPELLGPLEGDRPLSDWVGEILGLLARVYGREGVSRQDPGGRLLADALLRIREGALALHKLPEVLDEACKAHEAIRVLLGELEGDSLPPQALEEALELVGWLELHLDDAPVLFITGANEGTLPGRVDVDPFLPDSLRARLGLPDNSFRFARDAYILTAILHSRAGQVRVITGRRDAGGEPLRPSRFLFRGSGSDVARRVLQFAGEDPQGAREPQLEPLAVRPEKLSGFHLPPEPVLSLPELPRPIPVTAFRALLSDPYLWALERILKLEEVTDDLHELDPLAFGSLAHRVLEIFGHSPEAESNDVQRVSGRLESILEEVASDVFGVAPLPSVPIQVAQLKARLQAFARWQASWAGQGWRIVAVEARTVPEGAPFLVDGEPVYLSGRIDRIDIHQETGEWMIFDYKTGETGKDPDRTHRSRAGWKDLQLPLYRHLVRYLDGPPLPLPEDPCLDPAYGLGYLSLSRKEGVFDPGFAPWNPTELAEADETAREVIRGLRAQQEIRFQVATTGSRVRGPLATLLGQGTIRAVGPEDDGDDPGAAE